MQVHELKTLPVYFDAVERGEKTFEVRKDDRGFQKGDVLRQYRFDPVRGFSTTGGGWLPSSALTLGGDEPHAGLRQTRHCILWILTGGQFGVEPGYVVLALGPVEPRP